MLNWFYHKTLPAVLGTKAGGDTQSTTKFFPLQSRKELKTKNPKFKIKLCFSVPLVPLWPGINNHIFLNTANTLYPSSAILYRNLLLIRVSRP